MGTTERERELEAEIKRLRAELGVARERIVGLECTVSELKAALEKALLLSANSPTTPSGQRPTFTKPSKSRKETRAKKPGRKAGHAGASRKRPAKIDRTERHTLVACPHCGKPVKELRKQDGSVASRSRTIEDIVLGAMESIEHVIQQYWCHECNRRVEPVVATALPNARLGLNLVVTTAVQHYLYGVSIGKIVQMLDQQYGLRVTAGGLLQHWNRLASWLYFVYQIILSTVQAAGVLHADETGWRVNGHTWWLWCFATKTHVLFLLDESRSSDVPLEVLGNAFDGVLITDFYAAYNVCNSKGAQFCLAHLLREFKKIRAKRPDDLSDEFKRFERRIVRVIRDAISWSARSGAGPPERERMRDRFETRTLEIISEEYTDPDAIRLSRRILKHARGIFTFVTEPGVDPTNNWAETNIRPAVVTRKNSYGNQSRQGAATQAILMSVFRTFELQGKKVIPHVLQLLSDTIQSEHAVKYHSAAADA
jgi:hypothetical protein